MGNAGCFYLTGKAAFDKEIENDAFTGRPVITISRMMEDNDIVIAEGSVEAMKKSGDPLKAVFCDVFLRKEGKIKKLTTYLMELK